MIWNHLHKTSGKGESREIKVDYGLPEVEAGMKID